MVNAGKNKLGGAEALRLARAATKVVAAKGKTIIEFDMKASPPDDATLLAAILGPTGNLRAPAFRKGKTLVVGFNEETYSRLIK